MIKTPQGCLLWKSPRSSAEAISDGTRPTTARRIAATAEAELVMACASGRFN